MSLNFADQPTGETIVGVENKFIGHIVKIVVLDVRLADGTYSKREIIESKDAVAVLLVDFEDNIHLVRQYRIATGKFMTELIAGRIEQGENAENAAEREAQEELGVYPHNIVHLNSVYVAPGTNTEMIHTFFAQGWHDSVLPADEGEVIERVVIPFKTAYEMALTGGFDDAKTALAIIQAYVKFRLV